MKFTVETILDQLPLKGGVETKKLEKMLKLTKKSEREQLDVALNALNKIGILHLDEDGEIQRSQDDSVIESRLRCSSKGYCFALRGNDGEDIYIRDHNLNNGWNGDRVLVRVNREGIRRRSPEGSVQCVLERNTISLLCNIDIKDEKILAKPLDERIKSQILLNEVDKKFLDTKDNDHVFEVKIDQYPVAQFPAKGHIVRALPLNGGIESDIEILLTKANLHEQSNPPRSSLKDPSIKKRVDLTHLPTLLLQSWNSDDAPPLAAVNAEPMNGGVKIWVHAPAVSERMTFDSSLDIWTQQRGDAHCLINKWQPLLNKTLTKECQFSLSEENEAVSVALEISADGELINWEFMLSKIKPVAIVTPDILTAIVNRKPTARNLPALLKPYKEYIDQIKTLIFGVTLISDNEKKQGFIELDLPVGKLDILDDLNWNDPDWISDQWTTPIDYEDPNSLLCVCCRAANIAWAKQIQELQLPGLIVESSQIDQTALNEVAKTAVALDIKLNLNEDGNPTASELSKAFANSRYRRVLEQQLRYCLQEPVLKINEIKLKEDSVKKVDTSIKYNNNIQCPWVSPCLHYADIINQLVITTLLNDGKSSATTRGKLKVNLGNKNCSKDITWSIFSPSIQKLLEKIFVNRIANKQNNNRRKANNLKRDLISLAQARTIEKDVGQEVEGVISGVQSYGFFVELPESKAEGLVHVSSLNDDWYEYRSRQNKLVGRKSRRSYQLGDLVIVKVLDVDFLRNQIDMEISNEKEIVSSNNTDNDIVPIPILE